MPTTLPSSTPSSDFTAPHSLTAAAAAVGAGWFGGTAPYGNTGCGVFKRGGTKLERFLPKNQLTQRKLLNFENWANGEH